MGLEKVSYRELKENTDLSNYYNKSEVDNIISAISTLSFEVAQTKPTQDIKTNVIYLIPKSTAETDNVYDEWIYVNNAWELIGSTQIDVSNFLRQSQFEQQRISGSQAEQDIKVQGKRIGEHFIGANMTIYEVTQTGSWGCHINKLQQERDKVTSISSASTNGQYPSAKCVYDALALKADASAIPDVSGKENTSNKVTSLSSSSTDTQYPSAKCVYDFVMQTIPAGISVAGGIYFGLTYAEFLSYAQHGITGFLVKMDGVNTVLHMEWFDSGVIGAHIHTSKGSAASYCGQRVGNYFVFEEVS